MILRYYDMTKSERATLDGDQVTNLAKIEAMEAGVAVPMKAVLVPVPGEKVPSATYYQVMVRNYYSKNSRDHDLGLLFETMREAQLFIDTQDKILYLNSNYNSPDEVIDATGTATVASVDLALPAHAERAAALAKEVVKAENKNVEAERAYKDDLKAYEEVVDPVWADYRACKDRAWRIERLVERFTEYLEISGGDETTARRFFDKITGNAADEVEEAIGTRGLETIGVLGVIEDASPEGDEDASDGS